MHPSHGPWQSPAHTSEPRLTLFDSDLITIPLPHNHTLDDPTSLLPDIDYFALSEMGTTTGTGTSLASSSWDGFESSSMAALDTFEKTFGSYEYPQ